MCDTLQEEGSPEDGVSVAAVPSVGEASTGETNDGRGGGRSGRRRQFRSAAAAHNDVDMS